MRFTVAAAALFAGAASAGSTVYSTDYVTITSCAPEITNCPASSTVTYSSVATSPVISSSAPAFTYPSVNTTAPYPISSAPAYTVSGSSPELTTSAVVSAVVSKGTSPASESVLTISTTTCIPTVIYSTVTVTPTSVASSYAVSPSSGASLPGSNSTTTGSTSTSTTPVTAGAGALVGSAAFAVAAGLVAVFLA